MSYKQAPQEVIDLFLEDENPTVRMLAYRRTNRIEALYWAAQNLPRHIRKAVIANPLCPDSLLLELVSDPDPDVARYARDMQMRRDRDQRSY
ncbi:hypothetical protein [Streptoalloteichus hindustanus]|uniref:hypothetical protein n=1 Tax=Streptoalloteichus hindustanus TaxID=2017 RepID=UPI001161337D|nr:hypothetical protein [Streptoalloteichus hindustanus]